MNPDVCSRCGQEPREGQRLWPKTERNPETSRYGPVRICSSCLLVPRAGEPAERRSVHSQTRGARLIGSQNPVAKLDERRVREFLRLAERGVTVGELAKRFGIGLSTARAIKAGKKWRHVFEAAR